MSNNSNPATARRNAVSYFETSTMSSDGMPVAMRIYEPAGEIDSTLVWAHGGSWTRGSIRDWHLPCLALAQLGSARLVSVGYRLAPEWEHPTAMLDVEAGTLWAQANFNGHVFIGGDSAGGSLAAGVALKLRNSGVQLDGQILAYPPLDPDCDAGSYRQPDQPFPPRTMLRKAWAVYSGGEVNLRQRDYFAPLYAEHLDGLCPTAMVVGTTDPVRDDVEAFAVRLRLAGVPVSVRRDPSISHGGFLSGPTAEANPIHTWVHASIAHLISMKASNNA